MITVEDIKNLKCPTKLSALLGGYDKILEVHAQYGGVSESEYLCFKRFLTEYKQSKTDKNYPYYFDTTEAEDVIQIANMLMFYDSGKLQQFTLFPFQRFIILNLYGWRCKDDNTLRYRTAYISIGRRNGKSLLCSVLGIYYVIFSRFKSARGILISLTKEHAMIVFKQITDFFNADADLESLCLVENSQGKIRCKGTQNTLVAFSGNADKDGFTSNFAISDEQNASDGQLPQLIMDGQADQRQALFIGISTASFEIDGWGHKNYKQWKKQLENELLPATMFMFLCEPKASDDLHYYENEYTWLQANPHILWNEDGTPNEKKLSMYKSMCQEAFAIGGEKLVSFITKQCNTWCVKQDREFCNYKQLEKNARKYTFEDVAKWYKEWFMGIDLGTTQDLSSVTWGTWIKETPEGELLPADAIGIKRLYFHTVQFMPSALLDSHIKSDKVNYRLYLDKELILVEGERMNYRAVYDHIANVKENMGMNYKTIAVDPYNISSIQGNLEEICEFFIMQKQTPKALSEYLEQLQARINCGDVVYTEGTQDLFKRATLHCKVIRDSNGYFSVVKESGYNQSSIRIDSIDSLLDMVIAPLIEENREATTADNVIDEWSELFGG